MNERAKTTGRPYRYRPFWMDLARSSCAVLLLIALLVMPLGGIRSAILFGESQALAAEAVQETGRAQATGSSPTEAQMPVTIKLNATGVSDSQIALAWTIPAGGARYRVYRDGSLLGETGRISEYNAGLKADTRYCYRIVALDSSGIEISGSTEVCATTLPAETDAPRR